MRYYGTFRDTDDAIINVEIVTNGNRQQQREIKPANGLWFAADPVTIETDIENTFDHLIRKSCKISLVARNYEGADLFAENARSVEVNIMKGNECVFYGFVEPNTFNQPFAKPLEEFEINCIDALSTLQYYKYNGVKLSNFDAKRQTAGIASFMEIIGGIFAGITNGGIYYDLSRGITQNRLNTIFDDLGISELYLYGEDYDDTMTQEEVLTEMLKFLNLHIIQHGWDFFIFDWLTLKNGNSQWYDLADGTTATFTSSNVALSADMHGADDTTLTVSDVYNQIAVKDNLEPQEDVITSPLDKDGLNSLYSGKQLYMTEYISEGSGNRAHDAMMAMLNGNATTYDKAKEIDWYLQACNNKNWRFLYDGENDVESVAEFRNDKYINQYKLACFLKTHMCPYIFKFGSVEHQSSATDNSPVSKISMTPYLYISVNGNEIDAEGYNKPTDNSLQNSQPMAEYIGANSGGVLSPVDDDTTNYLVFSGRLLLQPIVYESGRQHTGRYNSFADILQNGMVKTEGTPAQVPVTGIRFQTEEDLLNYVNGVGYFGCSNLVKSDNNAEGRYYVRKFYAIENPTDKPPYDYLDDGTCGIQPWTKDKSARSYEYNYSQHWDSVDLYSKLPILECELIIGNKRLIETNIDEYGNSTFQWVTLGREPLTEYDGELYPITTFSLGINPKIGDYIIGDEFDLQNTITWNMNIDAEGTAIPIKKSDAVSGAVIFRILGPVNTIWNQISRRHPSFWRHTRWTDSWRFLLSHTENIIIKDFECKIYSDNAGVEIYDDKDLIYMSDETDRFVNKKDDVEFKFITQLSSVEALEKGVKSGINQNAVINTTTNQPIGTIYNSLTQETAKAEEHYVNQYYTAYSSPKIMMTATMHKSNKTKWLNRFTSSVLNKSFFIQSINDNIKHNTQEITFKEI